MRKLLALFVSLSFFSCSKDISTNIQHINGYWEIEEVQLANGEKRIYTINETIDYFSVDDSLNGFRKKIKTDLSGTFTASNHQESFHIKIENNNLNMYYSNSLSNWKETVLLATQEQLKIITQNKDVYLYKRFKPISFKD